MTTDPHTASTPDAHLQLGSTTGVQPLPEQFKHVQGPLPGCSLHSLATVELQLCLQFLDSKGKLIAARCSRRLLYAASAPFAWRSAAVTVTVRSAADVQHINASLLRLAPVHLRCVGMESLRCIATVPHLSGLELRHLPAAVTAADLSQLLQHPSLARLLLLRLDAHSPLLLTVDTIRLIARLPQLHSFVVGVPRGSEGADLLQPLADAPALTDLTIAQSPRLVADTAQQHQLLEGIGGCAGLHRLCLHNLAVRSGSFLALCSLPSMRRLRHLELVSARNHDVFENIKRIEGEAHYVAAFSALEQLRSLTLDGVHGVNRLLPQLHCAPTLRFLSFFCEPDALIIGTAGSALPGLRVLSAMMTAAPRLEVRLLLSASLDRWMALGRSMQVDHSVFKRQRRQLRRAAAVLDRVAVIDWEPPYA